MAQPVAVMFLDIEALIFNLSPQAPGVSEDNDL